jgi:UrcA family protein
MKTILTIAAALLASATPALSQPATHSVAVHYGDLNLASADGRAALDGRLRQAIRTACGDPSPADLRGLNRAANCRADLNRSLTERRAAVYAAAGTARPLVLVAAR